MADFLLIYRRNYDLRELQPSPQQLQNSISEWQRWHGIIAVRNYKADRFQYKAREGLLVYPGKAAVNSLDDAIETIGGLTFLQAETYDEALEVAVQCPILQLGGIVEIRMIHMEEDRK